jgi:hypothetical protein
MRTTVTIPDDILTDLMHFSQASSRTDAVNRAVVEWVQQRRIERLKALRGKLPVEGDLAALREQEIEEVAELDR